MERRVNPWPLPEQLGGLASVALLERPTPIESAEQPRTPHIVVPEASVVNGASSDTLENVRNSRLANIRAKIRKTWSEPEDTMSSTEMRIMIASLSLTQWDLLSGQGVMEIPPAYRDQPVVVRPPKPKVVEPSPASTAETGSPSSFTLRAATPEDIAEIVEVDLSSFGAVYNTYGKTKEELREQLIPQFLGRLQKVGGEWMPVLERDGKIVGFMTCCPTNKTPEEFASWEETTDKGTLNDTYDANGKNIYVVTLSVTREGSDGMNMLFAHQIGKLMREGYDRAFFESRMPGLRGWVKRKLAKDVDARSTTPEDLEPTSLEQYANAYFAERKNVDGKMKPLDKLLRLYSDIGCKLLKVVPDAYQDPQSLNFGVVCVYDGKKLPLGIGKFGWSRRLAGAWLQKAAYSQQATKQLFK